MSDNGSWGRFPKVDQLAVDVFDRRRPLPKFEGKALPRGNGRSYGDSCTVPGGTLLRSRHLDRFIAFDSSTGILQCEAGVLLDDIIRIAVPLGWFLPVTPGTRFVSVGGAIANDVHGKNHHSAGSFGNHVLQLELLRSDGNRISLEPEDQTGLFNATIGGLGLTGFIVQATLQMRRVPGPWLETESMRFACLDEFFELSAASATKSEYSVAWIDCLAKGRNLGRGHFLRADHAPGSADLVAPRLGVLSFPLTPPFSLVNQMVLAPFNFLYYHRQLVRQKRQFAHFRPYFYPLDGITNWNRMYGPKGFQQYQCVLPPANARDSVKCILEAISRSRQGSFLAVLKEFGEIRSRGLLSFPRPGTTLALDFPNSGEGPAVLFDKLDGIVREAGGAIYPAKDAHMGVDTFRAGFPNWTYMHEFIDPKMESGFWRRVTE